MRPQQRAARPQVAALAGGLAAGVLLCAGFITAPAAFGLLPEQPALAGRIAGRVFAWSYGLVTLAGLAALLASRPRRARR
ncbi:MAG: hypothetical protein JSW68_08855 [Burkholderiales bacterium]|nr:MAG: hypothetical protein JSW68_08855 [Burkholderiales bacterium]